jgi:hypothetical protein
MNAHVEQPEQRVSDAPTIKDGADAILGDSDIHCDLCLDVEAMVDEFDARGAVLLVGRSCQRAEPAARRVHCRTAALV